MNTLRMVGSGISAVQRVDRSSCGTLRIFSIPRPRRRADRGADDFAAAFSLGYCVSGFFVWGERE